MQKVNLSWKGLWYVLPSLPMFVLCRDDEKGYIFLCFSKRDFIDDHSVCDHDQNSFSFRMNYKF